MTRPEPIPGHCGDALAAVDPRRYVATARAPRRFFAEPAVRRVGIPVAWLAGSLVIGLLAAVVLLPGGRQPITPIDLTQPDLGRGPVAVSTGKQGAPGPAPSPTFRVLAAPDNVSFRLDRVLPALQELAHSPVIGLGADSYGQRHSLSSQPDQPDHIAILAVAAPYEAGVLGASALAIGFVLVLLALVKAAWRRTDSSRVAAYAGAVACLLVSYQVTNALNFSLIWLLAGAGLAAALAPQEPISID